MQNLLEDMLLLQERGIVLLAKEMGEVAFQFVLPCFSISLVMEYFGKWEFFDVVKKLLIILAFMGVFQGLHQKAVEISFDVANKTLKKVSPRNIFVRKWYENKLKTKEKENWSWIEKFAIPNLNDLLATAFFLLAKVFIWVLKLIYSTVYHFTYVFAGISALLYFFPSTNRSLMGTLHSSLWCILMPFVIVGILALIGNSIDEKALNGELALSNIENILWLFGITLILLLSPLITMVLINGSGISSAGATMGTMMTRHGLHVLRSIPTWYGQAKVITSQTVLKTGNLKRKLQTKENDQ
jgi:hypothetical protein